jgi:anaerobic magnesium-protoporphyrin IX monomethyl ester cyclase
MENNACVKLVFPPYWSFGTPYLAIPALVGHLRQAGISAHFIDLNIRIVDRFFSAEFMANSQGNPLSDYMLVGEIVSSRLDSCKQQMRTECLPDRVAPARNVLDHAMEVATAAFGPSRVDRMRYDYDGKPIMDLEQALTLSRDSSTNIFGSLINKADLDEIISGNPTLVGVSVTGAHQLVPSLTLVEQLKEIAPDVPIVIGGSMTLYMCELAQRRPDLFPNVDFIVVGEGETALLHLIEALEGERSMETVENLYFKSHGRFKAGAVGFVEDVDALGTPDFSEAPWDLYLTSKPIIPYLMSRGCYWDRCAFCSLCATFMNTYRMRSLTKVIDDLTNIRKVDGAKQVFFTDECFSPRQLETFSRALDDAGLDLEWDILARFEQAFEQTDFESAKEAGLNWITWGLESASPAVLARMNKGTDPEVAGRLLRRSHAAGIWNNIFVIFGFPGETDTDFRITRAFVENNLESIDSLAYANFRLEKGAPIFRDPEHYGIHPVEVPETYIGPAYPFTYRPPMDHRVVTERMGAFEAYVRQETHLSMVFTEGLSPATLKLAMGRLGGKAAVRAHVDAQAEYFHEIYLDDAWIREQRFKRGPAVLRRQPGEDSDEFFALAVNTGRIVSLNGAGIELLENLIQGRTPIELLRRRLNRDPTESELASMLPFIRHLLWRGLLEPDGAGALPPPPSIPDITVAAPHNVVNSQTDRQKGERI